MPVVFLPHGGGPWPFVEGLGDPAELAALAAYLRSVRDVPPERPKALLVVSAHWEERVPTVMTGDAPADALRLLRLPAGVVRDHLAGARATRARGARARRCSARRASRPRPTPSAASTTARSCRSSSTYPDADVPTVQLSLQRGLDPAEHLAIGRALAPLRDEGVFIVGSGMSYHNLRAFGDPRGAAGRGGVRRVAARRRDAAEPRRARRAPRRAGPTRPSARAAHPREEHLLPLMVVAGAAGDDRGAVAYRGELFGLALSGYQFGT